MIQHTANNLPHALMPRHICGHGSIPAYAMKVRVTDPRELEFHEYLARVGDWYGLGCTDLEGSVRTWTCWGEYCCGLGLGLGLGGCWGHLQLVWYCDCRLV